VLSVGNLTPIRDYLDVRDVIRAYQLLVTKGEPGKVYNVSSGKPLTVEQGLEILLQGARCSLEVVPDPKRQRPADIPYLVGDNTKLRHQTGWRPERNIRETLHELLDRSRRDRT
jgi:GDP-4-dehydro-6-deoxy-D-mannose reductase